MSKTHKARLLRSFCLVLVTDNFKLPFLCQAQGYAQVLATPYLLSQCTLEFLLVHPSPPWHSHGDCRETHHPRSNIQPMPHFLPDMFVPHCHIHPLMAYGVDKACGMEGKYVSKKYCTTRLTDCKWSKENPQYIVRYEWQY